jgi:antitoxin HigA-1
MVSSELVMAGHSRSKNGIASLAYAPAIHVLLRRKIKDVDARHKAGHDEFNFRCYNTMMKNRLVRGLKPMHPGEMLREDVMPALGKPKAEIARLLGISRQTLYDILDEKQPVTPGMALRLGKLLGNGPDLWINLQRAYDLATAERELAGEIKRIPTLTAA